VIIDDRGSIAPEELKQWAQQKLQLDDSTMKEYGVDYPVRVRYHDLRRAVDKNSLTSPTEVRSLTCPNISTPLILPL
jgi:hypothetical protein